MVTHTSVGKIPIGVKMEANSPHSVTKIKINSKSVSPIESVISHGNLTEKLSSKLRKLEFIGQLFPFQKKILGWSQLISRGILGLDMGLGKTVIMISIICSQNYKKTIIVMPLQLLEQWRSSIQKFSDTTQEEICVYQGPKRNSMNFGGKRIILTTYDVIRADMNNEHSLLYKSQTEFDCIVPFHSRIYPVVL